MRRLNFVENMKTFVVKVDNLDASAALVLHITDVSTVTKLMENAEQLQAQKATKNNINTKRKVWDLIES